MWCTGEAFEMGNPSKSIKVPCSVNIFRIKYRLLFIFYSFHPFHQKINSFNQRQLNAVCFFYLHHREFHFLRHCKFLMKGFLKILSFLLTPGILFVTIMLFHVMASGFTTLHILIKAKQSQTFRNTKVAVLKNLDDSM